MQHGLLNSTWQYLLILIHRIESINKADILENEEVTHYINNSSIWWTNCNFREYRKINELAMSYFGEPVPPSFSCNTVDEGRI